MFKITDSKGFQMTFANGITVSVQFGEGNYCENRNKENVSDISCENAEIWAWYADGTPVFENPLGWQTPDEVAAFIKEMSER